MPEDPVHVVKRLQMRSMRRGIKEMDLILSAFARTRLPAMNSSDLTRYEALLNESDHDLYQWVTGQDDAPEPYRVMIADIRQVMADGAVARDGISHGS